MNRREAHKQLVMCEKFYKILCRCINARVSQGENRKAVLDEVIIKLKKIIDKHERLNEV